MAKSNQCTIPIKEVNKMAAEAKKLRAALTALLRTARFVDRDVISMPDGPMGVHADSICSVNLREALKARKVLEQC